MQCVTLTASCVALTLQSEKLKNKKHSIIAVCHNKEFTTSRWTLIFSIHLINVFQNIDFTALNN